MKPVIDLYMRFEHKPEAKSRFDLAACSARHEAFVESKKGLIWCYLSGSLHHISAPPANRGDLRISNRRGDHVSSIFIPVSEKPTMGFGDYGKDAFLVKIEGNSLELYVARGMKPHIHDLFDLFTSGQLDGQIGALIDLAEARHD